jgi:hypothetical protein
MRMRFDREYVKLYNTSYKLASMVAFDADWSGQKSCTYIYNRANMQWMVSLVNWDRAIYVQATEFANQ